MINKRRKKGDKKIDFIQQQLRTIPQERIYRQDQNRRQIKKSNNANTQLITQSNNELYNEEEFEEDDQNHLIFINPQEQKIIKSILTLCRNGKINSANAFQIPIKTLTSDINANNLKFWRIASQMLGANISIYDKRIQNVYNQTYRVNGGLIRTNGPEKDNIEQNQQIISRDNILLQMTIKQFNNLEGVDKIIVGQDTVEKDAEKLNIQNNENQFLQDPLFLKISSMFDESSTKGLLLNAFQLSNDKQIMLLSQQQKQNLNKNNNMFLSIEQIDIRIKPYNIFDQLIKFQEQITTEFRKVRNQNSVEHSIFLLDSLKENQIQQFQANIEVHQQDQNLSDDGMRSNPSNPLIWNNNQDNLQINQLEVKSNTNTISNHNNFFEMDSVFQAEQFSIKQSQLGSGIPQLFTFTSPWDIPNKLNKKRRNLKSKLSSLHGQQNKIKISKKKKEEASSLINFSEFIIQQRKLLKSQNLSKIKQEIRSNRGLKRSQRQKYNQNIVRINYFSDQYRFNNLTLRNLKNPKWKIPKSEFTNTNCQSIPSQEKQFTFNANISEQNHDFNNQMPNTIQQNQQISNQNKIQNIKNNMTFLQSQTFQNKKKNMISIKQFKSKLYQKIYQNQILTLTNLHQNDDDVNLQTKFVTLLHLANQNNFQLHESQGDVIIKI